MPPVEGADARPEEPADLAPARGYDSAQHGKACADPELPAGARERVPRHRELEGGDSPARADDPDELTERRRRVVHVAQEVGEGERVEGRVLEGERLGAPFAELDPPAEPGELDAAPADGEHVGALVEPDDGAAVASRELDGDGGGAGGDVEDGVAGPGFDPRDEKAPPARVLPEAEQGCVAVVRGSERREQLEGAAVPLADRLGHRAIVAAVGLEDEIRAAFEAALAFVEEGEEITGVLPTEPGHGARVYLCSYERDGDRAWLALDGEGRPVRDQRLVRDAVSIAAMCELAEESAGGGDVGDLRARLVELRLTENPLGIEEAEIAAAELQATIARAPRVASVEYLDAIGLAAARLEQALGEAGVSPFAEAIKSALPAADELAKDVVRAYKGPLG